MGIAGVSYASLDGVSRSAWRAEVAKWQTRYVQGVVGVTPWEFKSPLRHHLQIGWLPEPTSILLGNSLKVERLILDQVVGVRIPVPQPALGSPRLSKSRVFLVGSTANFKPKDTNASADLHPLPSVQD